MSSVSSQIKNDNEVSAKPNKNTQKNKNKRRRNHLTVPTPSPSPYPNPSSSSAPSPSRSRLRQIASSHSLSLPKVVGNDKTPNTSSPSSSLPIPVVSSSSSSSSSHWFVSPECQLSLREWSPYKGELSNYHSNLVTTAVSEIKNILSEKWKHMISESNVRSTLSGHVDDSDISFLRQLVLHGTLHDKCSALSVSISISPILKIFDIEKLLNMAGKNVPRESEVSISTVSELFRFSLIPKGRVLFAFEERNFFASDYFVKNPKKSVENIRQIVNQMAQTETSKSQMEDEKTPNPKSKSNRVVLDDSPAPPPTPSFSLLPPSFPTLSDLIFWIFEDSLKLFYGKFLQILRQKTFETFSVNPSNQNKSEGNANGHNNFANKVSLSSLSVLYECFCHSPERERQIISTLIEKISDNEKRISSQAKYYLSEIINFNPMAKGQLAEEIFRNSIGKHCDEIKKFTQMINQKEKHKNDNEKKTPFLLLVKSYRILISHVSLLNSFRFSVSLPTDILVANRIIEIYLKIFTKISVDHENTANPKSKGNFTPAHHEEQNENTLLINSLKNKVLGNLLVGINRAMPYAMKMTSASSPSPLLALMSEMDSLFRIAHDESTPPATSIQSLTLIQQTLQHSKDKEENADFSRLSSRYYRCLYDKISSNSFFFSSNQQNSPLFFNLIYKSLKSDVGKDSSARCFAFLHRLLSISFHTPPNVTAAILLIISEIMKNKNIIQNDLTYGNQKDKMTLLLKDKETNDKENEKEKDADSESIGFGYDPLSRTPEFSKAEFLSFFEFSLLGNHFHPSVKSFITQMLPLSSSNSSFITYSGDPLVDFSSNAFLDKFSFKNPKKQKLSAQKGNQRTQRDERRRNLLQKFQKRFLNSKSGGLERGNTKNTREDDMFFHFYFDKKMQKNEGNQGDKRDKTESDSDSDDFADRIILKEMERLSGKMDVDDDEENDDVDFYEKDEGGEEEGEEKEENDVDFEMSDSEGESNGVEEDQNENEIENDDATDDDNDSDSADVEGDEDFSAMFQNDDDDDDVDVESYRKNKKGKFSSSLQQSEENEEGNTFEDADKYQQEEDEETGEEDGGEEEKENDSDSGHDVSRTSQAGKNNPKNKNHSQSKPKLSFPPKFVRNGKGNGKGQGKGQRSRK